MLIVRIFNWSSLLLSLFTVAAGQQVPRSECDDFFQYQRQGDEWIGRLKPNEDGLKSIDWTIRLSDANFSEVGSVGALQPYPDQETALDLMYNGGRAESFVPFYNYSAVLPKVTLVELNGKTLCNESHDNYVMTRRQHMSVDAQVYVNGTDGSYLQTWSTSILSDNNYLENAALTDNASSILDETHTTFNFKLESRSLAAPDECGVEGYAGLSSDDGPVTRGRFPWLTALYWDVSRDPTTAELSYRCVATLISARTVITAAHCIDGKAADKLYVYVGRHNLEAFPEPGATLMHVENVLVHPDYSESRYSSDLGLLELSTQVEYSIYVRPICLGRVTSRDGIVAGWGDGERGKYKRFPSMATMHTHTHGACLQKTASFSKFLTPKSICVSYSKPGSKCLGDSGGGLMMKRRERWYLKGLFVLSQLSSNRECDPNSNTLFIDVTKHREWIDQNTVE